MTPQHRIKSNSGCGLLLRCTQPIPRERTHQHKREDTRRAAHGSQPGRLFISLPVDTNSADTCSRTISAQHDAWQLTYDLVSAGTDSVMFRVVPCTSTDVKTSSDIRARSLELLRFLRHTPDHLTEREEARHA